MNIKEKLNEIDDILMQFEDWMHDEDGKNCTKARKLINEIKKDHSIIGNCNWSIIRECDDEYYETECGQVYCKEEGTLEESNCIYCSSCGKKIKLLS